MSSYTKAERAEYTANAIESLSELLKDNPRLLILTDYSPSGATRYTKVYVPVIRDGKPEIWDRTFDVAHAIGTVPSDRNGSRVIKATGWGYSHGTEITEALCRVLGKEPYSIQYTEQI